MAQRPCVPPACGAPHWLTLCCVALLAGCSFTLALSKGYLRTVDSVRDKLMVSEYELGLRPIALQM